MFTNLQPEHIESHGSFEKYAEAKLSLAKHLESSRKRPRYIVANADDKYGEKFMDIDIEVKEPFALSDAEPYNTDDSSVRFVWKRGELFTVPLPGVFNLRNILAALTLANAMGGADEGGQARARTPGAHRRPVRSALPGPQPYLVVVDYAHTPDSLKALYETYHKDHRIIGVLGSTGGGRDTWKRAEMGKIADEYCDVAILTNEDPYDEDPQKIVAEIAKGFSKKKPHIILNRHAAIRDALREGQAERCGTDKPAKAPTPYIMGPQGN